MDRNGYNDSIMSTSPGRCYLCGRITETVRHEIYFGPNRIVSKKNGFWVNICPYCHTTGKRAVHFHPLTGYDIQLKKECQRRYERLHGHDAFMKLIGRSYL